MPATNPQDESEMPPRIILSRGTTDISQSVSRSASRNALGNGDNGRLSPRNSNLLESVYMDEDGSFSENDETENDVTSNNDLKSFHSVAEDYKRLSMFSKHHDVDGDHQDPSFLDTLADTSKSLFNKTTTTTRKLHPHGEKKPLKIEIPSSHEDESNWPAITPILKTPARFRKSQELDEDLSSVLDEALFSSVWMPTDSAPPQNTRHSPKKTVNADSHQNLRRRKVSSASYNTDSFNYDLELNDAIPMKDLSTGINNGIKVDNYMASNQSQQDVFLQVPDQTRPMIVIDSSNNSSLLDMSLNISQQSLPQTIKDAKAKPVSRKQGISKMFAKLSNVVNADSPHIDESDEEDNFDNRQDEQEAATESEHQSETMSRDAPTGSSRLFQEELPSNKRYSNGSILKLYMDEIDRKNYQNDDIISVLNIEQTDEISVSSNEEPSPSHEIPGNGDDINGGNAPRLYGNSLKIFPPDSKLRSLCYKIVTSPITNQFSVLLLTTQVGWLAFQQWKAEYGFVFNKGPTNADWAMLSYYILYTLEMLAKIVAFGLYDDSQMIEALRLQRYENELQKFYKRTFQRLKNSKLFNKDKRNPKISLPLSPVSGATHTDDPFDDSYAINPFEQHVVTPESALEQPQEIDDTYETPDALHHNKLNHSTRYAYLRTNWNRVDFVSILSFWIQFGMTFNYKDIQKVQVFRALMCLRILRLLNVTRGSRIILRGLNDAASQSKSVILFLMLFWILLSIIGVETFESSFRRQCVWTNPNNSSDTYLHELQFCGSYFEPGTLEILPYLNQFGEPSKIAKGFACPVNSKCIIGENPYNDHLSFDNIVYSLQSLFVVMSANTFTDLMYYTMDSDTMASSLFFICGIFILDVWMINLVVAVILHSYKTEERLQKPHISWLEKSRQRYQQFVSNSKLIKLWKKVEYIFVLIILISFIYGCTKTREDGVFPKQYNTWDFITSIILMVEVILRFMIFVVAGDWKMFFFSGFNIIDLFLATVTLVISSPTVYNSISSVAYGWLSIFGILRFYRVIVSIKPVRESWKIALKRVKPFVELIIFGALLLFFVSIIMSRLFEGVVPEEEMSDTPWAMYNLPNSIVSLFIIMTTENWSDILYVVEQYSNSTFNAMCYGCFLIFWFFLSNTVLMSIFIAIITDNLELSDAEKKINQIKQFMKSCIKQSKNSSEEGIIDLVRNKFVAGSQSEEANDFLARMNELMLANGKPPIDISKYEVGDDDTMKGRILMMKRDIIESSFYKKVQPSIDAAKHHIEVFYYNYIRRSVKLLFLGRKDDENRIYSRDSEANNLNENHNFQRPQNVDRSLLVFTNENPIRRFCQMFISPTNLKRTEGRQPAPKCMITFSIFMFLSSIVVVILACYETPLYRMSKLSYNIYNSWMVYPDAIFIVIFTVEFFMRVIADGLLFGPRAYFKSFYNFLDFYVLMSFWVPIVSVLSDNYTLLVTFDAVRAFRTFRLLTINKQTQMVFNIAIISGAMKIISAALVSLSLLIPFSLWGLNIFSKEMSSCVDGVSALNDCRFEYTNTVFKWNVLSPNYVETPLLYFDNFGNSFNSLFQILSLEGWVDLLGDVVNITTYGEQPNLFYTPGNGFFVIFFIFVATIFIINLFISIIINNYQVQTGIAFLSNDQYGWYEVKKVLSRVTLGKGINESNMSYWQNRVYNFITKKKGIWSRYTAFILLLHFAALVSECYPDSYNGESVRTGIYLFTTLNLFINQTLFLYAIGMKAFFIKKWNIIITFLITTAFIMSAFALNYRSKNVFYNLYKVCLVSVLCLAIPQIDALYQLLKCGSTALVSLLTILYTWLVLYLAFAIAMNQVFGLTKIGPNTSGNINARTVTKALILLFRNSFGEGWNYIMDDFKLSMPYCTSYGQYTDCGNIIGAQIFFIVWNILSMYIFLNILISVVITNFSYVYHGSGPHKLITREELRKFKKAWRKFDPNGTGFIYEHDLYRFLSSLDGVLSYHVYPKYVSLGSIYRRVVLDENPGNGYDVKINVTRLEEILSLIDYGEIRQRRLRYARLVSELLNTATIVPVDNESHHQVGVIRKIPFSDSLQLVGFYSTFEDSTCLNLEDFLRHSAQIRLINRELRKEKILLTIKMIFTRLRYKYALDKGRVFEKLKNADSLSEKQQIKEELRKQLKGKDISLEVLMDRLNDTDEGHPVFSNQLYRAMSQSSRNPFNDGYVLRNLDDDEISVVDSSSGESDDYKDIFNKTEFTVKSKRS